MTPTTNLLSAEDVKTEWLHEANERYRKEGVPLVARPFRAFEELSKSTGKSICLSSEAADKIAKWFEANTKAGAHAIGPLFEGVFLFDACFWSLTIPIFFGQCRFDPLDSLPSMQQSIKNALWHAATSRNEFTNHWACCLDYALGVEALLKDNILNPRARSFLENADKELRGANSQLLELRPNMKAILGYRMATEIFLKVFLIQTQNLSENALKNLGHKIDTLAQQCSSIEPIPEFAIIENAARIFPPVSDRYDGTEKTAKEVFQAATITQLTAATITRRFSGQDIRDQI